MIPSGIVVPLVSVVAERGSVDLDATLANAERVLAAGASGLYLCGGTGDAAQLRERDRRAVTEAVLPAAQASGAGVIVHVGSAPVHESYELAAHAMAAGADAVASVPLRGAWHQNLAYYGQLGAVAGSVFVYHMPPAGFTATFEQLSELLELDGVVGAKVSDWNLFLLRRLVEERPDLTFYSGLDEILAFGLLSGARGSIGTWSNLVPGLFVRIFTAVAEGRHADALELQAHWQRFLHQCWRVDVLSAFEALMARRGYADGCFRSPSAVGPLGAVEIDRLERALAPIEAWEG